MDISWCLCLRNLDTILPSIFLLSFATLEIHYLPIQLSRGSVKSSLRASLSSCAHSVLYKCESKPAPISTYTIIIWMFTPKLSRVDFIAFLNYILLKILSWYSEGCGLIFQDKIKQSSGVSWEHPSEGIWPVTQRSPTRSGLQRFYQFQIALLWISNVQLQRAFVKTHCIQTTA